MYLKETGSDKSRLFVAKGQLEPWELHHALVTAFAIAAEVSSLTHWLKSPAVSTPHTNRPTEVPKNTLLVFSLQNTFHYALFQMEKEHGKRLYKLLKALNPVRV